MIRRLTLLAFLSFLLAGIGVAAPLRDALDGVAARWAAEPEEGLRCLSFIGSLPGFREERPPTGVAP